jgi:ATP-dependent helicase IRC3
MSSAQLAFGAAQPAPRADYPLRDYQLAALDAIRDAAGRNVRRQLVVMATGLGKGHLLGYVPGVLGAKRTLVLAHRVEILDQLAAHMARANPHYSIAVEQGARCEGTPSHDVIVASVPTLMSARRRSAFAPDQFDLVMHDESHHVAAKSHLDILRYFGVPEPDGPLLVGFTATPMRGDKIKLANVFDEVVFDKSLKPAKGQRSPIEEGWLVNVVPVRVETVTDIRGVKVHSGDFAVGQLERSVNTADRNDAIISAINAHAADRKTILVFAAGVDHAEALTARMEADGMAAACVIGTTPDRVRRGIWRSFASGKTRVVVNVAVATEGFDCPAIDCLVMARPTKSALLFTQMLGRGMRPSPGKENLLVLDVADVCGRHRVQNVARLFGLRCRDLLGRDVIEAAKMEAAADAAGVAVKDTDTPKTLERRIRAKERRSLRVKTRAQPVDLFGAPVTTPKERATTHSAFPWLSVGSDSAPRYVLELARGSWAVLSRGAGGIWGVQCSGGGENLPHSSAAMPDWAGADRVVKRYAGHWSPPDKPWLKIPRWRQLQADAPRRQRPATDGQRQALARWRLPVPADLSFGQASDALSRAVWQASHGRS